MAMATMVTVSEVVVAAVRMAMVAVSEVAAMVKAVSSCRRKVRRAQRRDRPMSRFLMASTRGAAWVDCEMRPSRTSGRVHASAR